MGRTSQRGVFERPRGSGVWWINYRDAQGRRHREKVGRKRVALEAYLQRQIAIREGKFAPPRAASGPAFRELAEERMARMKHRLRPASLRTDRQRLGPLLAAFGDLTPSQITADRVGQFLAGFLERGRTPATANRYLWLLRAIYSDAIRHDRVTVNPCAKVQNMKEAPSRVRFLSDAEELALRKAIVENFPEREPEFDLALHTGMRRGEQYGLKWTGVDLENGILTVSGKTGQRRVVANSIARAAIERLRGQEERVCAADRRRWFARCIHQAGVRNFRWHDLRHTFASRLVMSGVDIRSVQELLGHKSITMTMKYSHLSPAHQQANVEKLTDGHQKGTSAKEPSAAAP